MNLWDDWLIEKLPRAQQIQGLNLSFKFCVQSYNHNSICTNNWYLQIFFGRQSAAKNNPLYQYWKNGFIAKYLIYFIEIQYQLEDLVSKTKEAVVFRQTLGSSYTDRWGWPWRRQTCPDQCEGWRPCLVDVVLVRGRAEWMWRVGP